MKLKVPFSLSFLLSLWENMYLIDPEALRTNVHMNTCKYTHIHTSVKWGIPWWLTRDQHDQYYSDIPRGTILTPTIWYKALLLFHTLSSHSAHKWSIFWAPKWRLNHPHSRLCTLSSSARCSPTKCGSYSWKIVPQQRFVTFDHSAFPETYILLCVSCLFCI